jgi:hypothetical protein
VPVSLAPAIGIHHFGFLAWPSPRQLDVTIAVAAPSMKLLPFYFGSSRRKREHHPHPFGGCLSDHHDALNHIVSPPAMVVKCSH